MTEIQNPKYQYHNLLLCLGSVLLFFLALETSLALFWPHKVTTRAQNELYHPIMGWVNKPDVDGEREVTRNVFFHRRHNSKGLRSLREFSYNKPPGVKRILLIGDSFFWGYGVDDRDIISEVLQRKVRDSIEVINGAVTGYATDQELLWLVEEGLKYQPDLVILGCFPTNDLADISVSVMMGYPKPFFAFNGDRLVARNVPVPDTRETRRKAFDKPDTVFGRLKKFLRHHIHTYQFITGRLNSIPTLRNFFLKVGLAEEFTTALPGVPEYRLKSEKVLPLFNALIKEIKQVSEEAGADFLLVFIPEKEQDPENLVGYSGIREGAFERNSEMSLYLSQLTSDNNMKFLDLLPIIRQHHNRGKHIHTPEEYNHHWSPLGHRVAADAIFERLKKTYFVQMP